MNVSIEQQLTLLKKTSPQVRRIGVIYDPSKTGWLVRQAERIARDQGVKLVTKAIASSKDSFAALDAMRDEIDALWILPDLTVLAPESVQYMLLFSFRHKIPVLGSRRTRPAWAPSSASPLKVDGISEVKPLNWQAESCPAEVLARSRLRQPERCG